jgi:cytidylate kinase
MTVITLARQVGSGGQTVAMALSQRLDLRVIGRKELREEASARGLSLPESFVRFASEDSSGAGMNHYLSYGELEFDLELRGGTLLAENHQDTGFLTEISAHSREILLTLQVLIYELAAHDDVLFVGAGAQILLAEIPQVFRVKIIAPVETRIKRMVTAYSLSVEEARLAVLAGDQEQVDYNRVIFGEDWHNPELWDIVVNSEALSIEQIVDLIASRSSSTSENAEVSIHLSRAAAINRAMLDSTALESNFAYAMPTTDGIVVRGEVANDDLRTEIMELALSLSAGVSIADGLSVHSMF